jgi:Sigma-70 factor, region 1.1
VIRAYPKPWHVFVDTSPDTDADFVVAATFDDEPPLEEVNRSIVECLEGSEEEDEIVAQQMQQALESGQLDRVTEMLGSMGVDIFDEDDDEVDDDDDFDDDVWNIFKEDSV